MLWRWVDGRSGDWPLVALRTNASPRQYCAFMAALIAFESTHVYQVPRLAGAVCKQAFQVVSSAVLLAGAHVRKMGISNQTFKWNSKE